MDPLTAALNLITQLVIAYNNESPATKSAQGAAWQTAINDVLAWFAAAGIKLPPIVVYIPPPTGP